MKGKLYGIGAGPGDPELLTVKAVNAILKCGVIAAPKTGSAEGIALGIVRDYIGGKELLECRFDMDKDGGKREEARKAAAEAIIGRLEEGTDVGFITLGDPTTYSTYMYVHGIVVKRGYEAMIIPGVTSYQAAAAAFGVALCEGGETLTIIPARHGDDIDALLDAPGNKVVMKSGGNLANLADKLGDRGLTAKIACRVTMEGQRLYRGMEEYAGSPDPSYLTVAIIKKPEA